MLTPDVGDLAASDLEEVFRCHVADQDIVGSDEVRVESVEAAIHEDQRNAFVNDSPQALRVGLARGNDQYIHVTPQHLIDIFFLQLRIFIGIGDQESKPLLPQYAGQALCSLGEECMYKVRNDQAGKKRLPWERPRASRLGR